MFLAILSIFGGWVAAPHLIGGTDYFDKFLHPVFAAYAPASRCNRIAEASRSRRQSMLLHALTGWPVIIAPARPSTRLVVLHQEPGRRRKSWRKRCARLYTLILHKYYVDEIYTAAIIQPLLWISTNVLWHVVDEGVIDGTVNGTARVARETGAQLREIQSGNTRSYARWVVIGAVGITC